MQIASHWWRGYTCARDPSHPRHALRRGAGHKAALRAPLRCLLYAEAAERLLIGTYRRDGSMLKRRQEKVASVCGMRMQRKVLPTQGHAATLGKMSAVCQRVAELP